jgi:acetolactate synthase-1/2/3 large subunit
MKLSDYVFEFIADLGVDHVFMIVGGGNSHLADSLSKNKKLKYICTQHEQAAAMAAEGYARASGRIGCVLVTSGPGGTNTLTGLCGSWCDSVPVIFISGQVPTRMNTDGKTIRQLGVQQLNIIDFVKAGTKFSVLVDDPLKIRYYLEKSSFLAKHGRPGPAWIDIPTEFQHRMDIKPEKIERFKPEKPSRKEAVNSKVMNSVIKMLKSAQRPILIVGHGIRIADATKSLQKVLKRLDFPIITTWNGIDLIPHDHPLYLGCAGVMGQRSTNYAVANADLIISVGSRMDTRQVGNDSQLYATKAKKIVVDIDKYELNKNLIKIDIPIQTDAKLFLESLYKRIPVKMPNIDQWRNQCQVWRKKYPIVLSEYQTNSDRVNSYVFIKSLCQELAENDVVVTDMGTSLTCTMQTFFVKKGQRLFTNTGLASMGFGLPATIGAWFGRTSKALNRVIGIYGDGGLQMNIQELQTVVHYNIPAKIFVLNNESYLTLKHTQEMFFEGHLAGSSPETGYSAPSFSKIARAYGIKSFFIDDQKNINKAISEVLNFSGPVLCEVMMPKDQQLIPLSILNKAKGYVGAPIEIMYPFLSDEEHQANMI